MHREFWSEAVTRASWEKLQELSKQYDFIVIGGWSAYLWTKMHKSKDIDIIVDYDVLRRLGNDYRVEQNERLKKYEIKLNEFDIDIYLPKFSVLGLPIGELVSNTTLIEGIKTISSECLVILKQAAELDRSSSIKGKKDRIDIITILSYAAFDIKRYKVLLKKYKKENYFDRLLEIINEFPKEDLEYIGLNAHTFSKWKKEILKKFKYVYRVL